MFRAAGKRPQSRGAGRQSTPRLAVDPEAVQRIHQASLALLEEPGVRLEHEEICEALRRAGARPGSAAQVLRLPRQLVEESLAQAPSEVVLADRQGGQAVLAPDSPSRVWSAPGMYLWRAGQHRPFTSQDLADLTRLLDRLPRVDGVFGVALEDVPPAARDVVGLRIMAENTRKHIRVLCFSPAGAQTLCAMRPVLGQTAWFSVGFTAHGPLRWTHLALETFRRTAGHRIPATLNGEPMAGVSAPVTLAGAAAVGNAEILAGLVVNQVLEPGRPCIYNLGLAHTFDMRHATAVTGGPENHLLAGLSAALGRFYRLPSCSWVSTESMEPDSQAALEKAMGFLTHHQSRVSLIWGVGQLESEMTLSPAQAVIDDEIIAYLRRYQQGVAVTDETLALEVIRQVDITGSFLDAQHTLAHFRQELFEPSLLFRNRRAWWPGPLAQVAQARADELIRQPAAPALEPEQARALRRIEDAFLRKATR